MGKKFGAINNWIRNFSSSYKSTFTLNLIKFVILEYVGVTNLPKSSYNFQ
jgi:hypothetical protein